MKHYCLHCGVELKEDQLICPKCEHCFYLDLLSEDAPNTISGVLIAQQIEANTQWVKYKCGKDGLTGHGFAAEDANALNEILLGFDVDSVGKDNAKGGPDRITNNIKIQTKYYQTAKGSVEAGFDSKTGKYIYTDQILEVPLDQYDEAVLIMREKIKQGCVEGVTDPNDATKIVKKGSITYQQAKNITKSGNIDSLIFDAKTQSITAVSAFGISFAVNLGMILLFHKNNKLSAKEAMQIAFLSGLQNGTISMASGILTSQVLRTQFGRNLAAYIQWSAKSGVNFAYKGELGKNLVHQLAKSLFGKGVYGGAAKNAVVKFVRLNAITNIAVFIVSSLPDTFYMLQGKMSKPQYIKNLMVAGSSVMGGTLGAVLGSILGPYGMIGGGLAGGVVFSWTSKKVADYVRKDDTEKMYQLIQVALIRLSHDYMIQSDDEFQACINVITDEKAINTDLIRIMYSIGCDDDNDLLRVQVAYEYLEYYFGAIIRRRKTVKLMENQQMLLDSINDLGNQIPQVS